MNLLSSATKVLVLGGRGFLGTHLVDSLLRQRVPVRIYDRGPAVAVGCDGAEAEMHIGDFATGDGLDDAVAGVDLVYHLISTTVPSTSNADPAADVEGNLLGTLRLLASMRRHGAARIVFVSSGGTVYGNPSILPVPEHHPLQPLCSYGVVKVAIEHYLSMFAALEGLQATVLRVSNPYGTHQRRIGVQGVIPTFASKIAAGDRIEIWGDGSVVRDYVHVDDVVDALLRAGASERSGVYNIGSGVGHDLNRVLDLLVRLIGRPARVEYLPQRNFDVGRIFLDVGKAEAELGWRPSLSLEEGCARYWRAVREGGGL